MKRLNWCNGNYTSAGWLHVAEQYHEGVKLVCDMLVDGLAIHDNSIDSIASQHNLERFKTYQIPHLLREFIRVLKPGGVLRVAIIDFEKAARAYLACQDDYLWCRNWRSASANFLTQICNYGLYRTLMDYTFLEELLESAGFEHIQTMSYRGTSSID